MTLTKKHSKISPPDVKISRGQLLDWYDRHQRDIPWRAKTGEFSNPYHVWLSEIMCQQTTVQAVKAYYTKFLEKWPTVQDLANARQEDVMAAWAGLGYYARARNLHKCANVVANDLNGTFPEEPAALKRLPGIGDYTSAAITAIAFNKPATVVDGNVERVVSRLFAVEEPLPTSKKQLKKLAGLFFEGFEERPGDLAQAFMDLGAGVCIPKAPRCALCPLLDRCQAYADGVQADLPRKIKKAARPQKYGHVYWVQNGGGETLFHKRPEKGLLGSMVGLPTSDWQKRGEALKEELYPSATNKNMSVHHTFTHFDLELSLYSMRISKKELPESDYYWGVIEKEQTKLPSVFKKAFKAFQENLK